MKTKVTKPFAARHNDDGNLTNIHITERDILETVNNSNVNKTLGHDKISPESLDKSNKKSFTSF